MKTITGALEVFETVRNLKSTGKTVGVVPTMGAIHEGHLSLVRAAKTQCDFVVTTIFINPTQFGPQEDLSTYPRPLENDLSKLGELNVDIAFCPGNQEVYPEGFSTFVDPPEVALPFEGQVRPDHFRGVATVVLKLFQIVPADFAFFGQKDLQQTLVVQTMVRDLNLPIQIIVCPIVRESDGLALSSRNTFLSPEERQRSTAIHQTLTNLKATITNPNSAGRLLAIARENLRGKVDELDYLEIVDAESLQPITSQTQSAAILVAAKIGSTRLIDNELIALNP
ncbi:MAG: pantoate--beta-alanine ligase [Planctomycetota bacterium]|nr:pantoate--beta-alanine ligase [Planctomycetota bacterium]